MADIIQNGADSAMTNPTASVTAELSTVATSSSAMAGGMLSSLGAAISSAQIMAVTAKTHVDEKMQSAKIQLPIMAAVERSENAKLALSGETTGSSCSTSVGGAFASLTTFKDKVTSVAGLVGDKLHALASEIEGYVAGHDPIKALTDFVSGAPAKTIPDPDDPTKTIPNPEYTAWAASHASFFSALTSTVSEIEASVAETTAYVQTTIASEVTAISNGISRLKDEAFAAFASTTQSPCMTSIMGTFMPPVSPETIVSRDMVSAAAAQPMPQAAESSTESQAPKPNVTQRRYPASPDTVRETSTTPATATVTVPQADVSNYKSLMVANVTTLENNAKYVDADLAALTQLKISLNYDAKRDLARQDRDNQANWSAYMEAKNTLEASDTYVKYALSGPTHNDAVSCYNQSKQVFAKYTAGGCPNGITISQREFVTYVPGADSRTLTLHVFAEKV